MSSLSALENVHAKGQFGDFEGKDDKNLLSISETTNLLIVQIVQYKSSNSSLLSINCPPRYILIFLRLLTSTLISIFTNSRLFKKE